MLALLQQQYALLQFSRALVFDFLQAAVGDDINSPVAAFDNKTIRQLLEHNASCHFSWLAYFALKQPDGSLKDEGFATMPQIRQCYKQVDDTMALFLGKFNDQLELPIEGIHNSMGHLRATPLQVFTHVVTHEFHHKGQILSMCRILGYIPPDTDVSGVFETLPPPMMTVP